MVLKSLGIPGATPTDVNPAVVSWIARLDDFVE